MNEQQLVALRILFVEKENSEGRLEGEERAEGWLFRRKKSYIFSEYAEQIVSYNEPSCRSFSMPKSVSV